MIFIFRGLPKGKDEGTVGNSCMTRKYHRPFSTAIRIEAKWGGLCSWNANLAISVYSQINDQYSYLRNTERVRMQSRYALETK